MSTKVLVACCDTMYKMQCQALVQWKQKLNWFKEGVYFCPPETTHYGSTARRCGDPLENCPWCPEKMPTNAKELEEFNARMTMKRQLMEIVAK